MEITPEVKIKMFSLYLGESILICEPNIEPVPHYLEGVDFELKQVIAERVNYNPDWIKLILKPLSGGIGTNIDYDLVDRLQLIPEETILKYGDVRDNDFLTKMLHVNVTTFQYFISKGYDIPQYLLGGKTLEQVGLAIYKNKTYTDEKKTTLDV